jgi:two-component system, chemotaxis family, CheB/CheR fusion protein
MIEPCSRNALLSSFQLFSQFLPSQRSSNQNYPARKGSPVEAFERPRSALVVDDVSDVTDMLSMLLTHAGYDVTCASTAPEALARAREQRFDMVISDIGMPEMNGYELAKALRSLPGYEAVPLVAVTGYSMFDDRSRSLTAGFNEHVTKPIDPRAFLDLIEQL